MAVQDSQTDPNARKLPVWGFVILAILYLAAIQLAPRLFQKPGAEYATFTSSEDVLRNLLPAVLVGSAISLAVTAYLRWWHPAMVEENRSPRWTWVFPAILVAASLAAIDYSGLVHKGLGFTLLLLSCALLVGVSEETMFRGIGVVAFRRAGFSEGHVALWTCVAFGLAHATNIFEAGPKALVQVLVTASAGYFFYLTRRASGFLVVGMVVHGLWDFGLFSNASGVSLRGVFFILADVVLAIVAVSTFRKTFRRPTGATAGDG